MFAFRRRVFQMKWHAMHVQRVASGPNSAPRCAIPRYSVLSRGTLRLTQPSLPGQYLWVKFDQKYRLVSLSLLHLNVVGRNTGRLQGVAERCERRGGGRRLRREEGTSRGRGSFEHTHTLR